MPEEKKKITLRIKNYSENIDMFCIGLTKDQVEYITNYLQEQNLFVLPEDQSYTSKKEE